MKKDLAIKVENLGKKYQIGSDEKYATLRDTITNFGGLFKKQNQEEFWALKDVSFEIKKGEVLGLIGANGAGKSTLLKILSQITKPTEGKIQMRGRVASLLEVGTGFHPELTGRENIYISGIILGMTKQEIKDKFEEIVEFSGLEKFLDTPVKRYSSGMRVRLAFSVAAHLDPEILLVDEVLAVGDAEFQKKSLGKMDEVTKGGGRTIIFVSHNMSAIKNLCNKCIFITKGKIEKAGYTDKIINYYLSSSKAVVSQKQINKSISELPEDDAFELLETSITQDDKRYEEIIYNDLPINIKIKYKVKKRTKGLRVYFDLLDIDKSILVRTFHDERAKKISNIKPGTYISEAVIPTDLLAPKKYELCIRASIFNKRTCTGNGLSIKLSVVNTVQVNKAYLGDKIRSKILPCIKWTTKKLI